MAPKRKTETFKSNIPWENVGSTTLRVVCRDVAGPSTTIALRTKETMISFLWDLEQHGLEVAVETLLQQSPEPSKSAAPATPTNTRTRTTSLKRKKPEPEPTAEESDEEEATEGDNALPYNTRHKGQKRVRVTAPPLPKMSSVRRRSTASRTVKKDVEPDDSEDATGETSVTPVKRGRGRPRKSAPTAAPAKADAASGSAVKRGRGRPRKSAASPPKKAGKQVFDGIELKRAKTRETTGDVDADGEPDDEALAVPNGETSSLGSSNKENNPELAFTAPEETLAAEAVSAQMSLVDAINLSNNPA